MKNTFGQHITLTLFGESHGAAVGAVLDGLSPGIPVEEAKIAQFLAKRRPTTAIDTARREPDNFRILSGVFAGKTTGTPLCIVIPNEDTRSKDYTYGPARPSHADFAAYCKYHGFEDFRGGGHFSGRITAALVAAGGILLPALGALSIRIGTHILQCETVRDRAFRDPETEIDLLAGRDFPTIDPAAGEAMLTCIADAKEHLDSVGGVTQTAICGVIPGLGEPWFDSVEGLLSHALFSLGGIKGVEFGLGFAFSAERASRCNDPMRMQNGRPVTLTNNNGGVNGGITNGMPILFQCAVKPTPSIAQEQQTVDFCKGEDTTLAIRGRHDPAIIRRICPVIDAVSALVIADLLSGRFGTDVFLKGVPPCNTD